jgi:hypothetical protein
MGPKYSEPQRMNTNEEPQIMDRRKNDGSQLRKGGVFTSDPS